ncbi:MAG: deoxyribose-phosphate aldolase [Candidatus Zixiibacteriota bacterium]
MIPNLSNYFDHAQLHSDTTSKDIARICQEAIEYDFYSIAINPYWVKFAKKELTGTNIKILSVSGFPLSASTTDIKISEAVKGVADGADEIDMVANVGLLVEGEYRQVEEEIALMRKILPEDTILKVIIEAPKLTPEQQIEATKCVINGGAEFVKTCTGFFGGATVEMVKRLHETANGKIKVKASGGIKTLAETIALIEAGAKRIGSSSSVAIIKDYMSRQSD